MGGDGVMSTLLKPMAVATYCAVLAACALASGVESPSGRSSGPKSSAVLKQGVASDQKQAWFLLDSGFGYEGFPILYRLDDCGLSESISFY